MTTDAKNVFSSLIAAFEPFAEPLEDAVSRRGGAYDFLATRGWNLAALKAADLSAFEAGVERLRQGLADLLATQSFEDLNGIAKALSNLGGTLDQLDSIRSTLVAAAQIELTPDQLNALARDVLECLVIAYLRKRLPRGYEVLLGLTLIQPEQAKMLVGTGDIILRYPIRRPALHFENLGKLITDPLGHLKNAYIPGEGLVNEEAAIEFASKLFGRLEALIFAVGGKAMAGLADPLDAERIDPANEAFRRSLSFAFSPPSLFLEGGSPMLGSRIGGTLVVVPADGVASDNTAGPALEITPFGMVSLGVPLGGWTFELERWRNKQFDSHYEASCPFLGSELEPTRCNGQLWQGPGRVSCLPDWRHRRDPFPDQRDVGRRRVGARGF